MIAVISDLYNIHARDLVVAALRRSVSSSLVRVTTSSAIFDDYYAIIVCINPDDRLAEKIIKGFDQRKKIIVFGALPESFSRFFQLTRIELISDQFSEFDCVPAKINDFSESLARIEYIGLEKKIVANPLQSRPVCRYDFDDEWNNLGYGAIKLNGNIWSVSCFLKAQKENEIAQIKFTDGVCISFISLFEPSNSSLLWVNRPVGLIDSGEWVLIEKYISSWKHELYPCVPVLSEIPFGYDSLISMRLDCDEDLFSAYYLWQHYRQKCIPFSIAVHAAVLSDQKNVSTLKEMASSNVGIMSHSLSHAPNWGGTYDAAVNEAIQSRNLIENITASSVDYAVSPFHQTPHYALRALSDVGYRGCIGGIISNDPEFLLGRGGLLANIPRGFIGHSQQCMLHGDCLSLGEDPLATFKQAFEFAKNTETSFCYLDHPISARYDYAWGSEDRRAQFHMDLLSHIKSKTINPCFVNEVELLDYFSDKSEIELISEKNLFHVIIQPGSKRSSYHPAIEFKGNQYDSNSVSFL